jgi:hypothetical protein
MGTRAYSLIIAALFIFGGITVRDMPEAAITERLLKNKS